MLWNLGKFFHLSELESPLQNVGIMLTSWGGIWINYDSPCKALRSGLQMLDKYQCSYFLFGEEERGLRVPEDN